MGNARAGLRKLAKNRQFDELEAACLEDVESGVADRGELVSAMTLAAHRAEPDRVETLLWVALTAWSEHKGDEEGLSLAGDLAPLAPQSEMLRDEVSALYERHYAGFPNLDALNSTILATGADLPDAIRRMDALLRLPPGGFCRLPRGKVAGQVVGPAEGANGLVVLFTDGEKVFDIEDASRIEPLPDDDFRSVLAFDPERLAALATDDPCLLVESLLRAHGPESTYREIRGHLSKVVPGTFPSWWNVARPKLSRSAWIDMTASSQPTLTLRKVPVSHALRKRRELVDASPGVGKALAGIDYLEEAGEEIAAEEDILTVYSEVLAEQASGSDPVVAWGSAAVLTALQVAAGRPEPGDGPGTDLPKDMADFSFGLSDPRLQRLVFEYIRGRRDDWPDVFAAGMPACFPEICEWIADILDEEGHGERLRSVAAAVMHHPSRFPPALVWLWKEIGEDGRFVDRDSLDHAHLLCHVLVAIDRDLRRPPGDRHLSTRLRSVLSAKGFKTAYTLLESASRTDAVRIRDTLKRCVSFSDDLRGKVSDIIVEMHPKLYAADVPPWDLEDVVYTTAGGLMKKREELTHMVEVVLPGIADAIGRAAAHGDLSENAEYTAALEERERMTERANSLQADLAKAQVMQAEMAGDRMVTVGSRVRARNRASMEEREFVFLGPWDVDFDAGVYSYRAPLSLAFMGHRVGELVDTEMGGESQIWEVLEISSGIPD